MVSGQLYTVSWASWGAVFAGGISALAISVVLALLGVALGFTVVAPKSDDPVSGLGIAFGYWSFFSVVASMAGGGFVAGLFAGQRGLLHGFLVWALVILVAIVFSGFAVGSALKTLGLAVKTLGAGAAELAGVIGKGTLETASRAIAELREKITFSPEFDHIGADLKGILRDTGVAALQPEYLHEQLRKARSDLREALYQLSLNPLDSEKIIAAFLETEKSRLEALTKSIDRDAAVEALMHTRNIPKEDAERMVDNAITAYEQGAHKVKETLAEAGAQLQDAKGHLKGLADTAREKADKVAALAAKASLAAAAALILAAFISAGAGACGAGFSPVGDVAAVTAGFR